MCLKRPSRDEGLRRELRQYLVTDESRCLRAKSSNMQNLGGRVVADGRRDYSSAKVIEKTKTRKNKTVLKKLRSL